MPGPGLLGPVHGEREGQGVALSSQEGRVGGVLATAQAGPGLRQLGWSRSAPGAAGHTADSPRHLHFALRRQTLKLPGLIAPGIPAPPVAHPEEEELPVPRSTWAVPGNSSLLGSSSVPSTGVTWSARRSSPSASSPQVLGEVLGRAGHGGRQHQAPADGKRGDTRK